MKAAMAELSGGNAIDSLRKVPLFAELDDEALRRVIDSVTEFEAAPGHVLVQPNLPGAGLFVIEEGTVTVEVSGRSLELGPGEFFGDLALLTEEATHSARVCAATPLKCLAIRRDDFDALLEDQPRLAVSMLRTVAQRLADSTRV
jgi:CRP-like cAMP-binding protein